MKILLWILYICTLGIGVALAQKYADMTGYWIGFLTYGFSSIILTAIRTSKSDKDS